MLRIIREEEPPKPSTRLSTHRRSCRRSPANRQAGAEEAERAGARRAGLDRDEGAGEGPQPPLRDGQRTCRATCERYLRDEPVQACPPSAAYRFRKFARRNKASLAVGLALGIAVLLAVAGLIVNNRMVTREKNQKEAALTRARWPKRSARTKTSGWPGARSTIS